MSAPIWDSLPLEVWINVFDQFNRKKDLAQCRLVCKTWDPLAEKAMFRQAILFPEYKKTAVQLYYHLIRKPHLKRYIKKVKMIYTLFIRRGINFFDPLIIDLSRHLFTPEIEAISGPYVFNGDFLPAVIDDGYKASELACKFKDTLEFLDLTYDPNHAPPPSPLVVASLDTFVRLKSVSFILDYMPGIEEIHEVLKKTQNVESMTLEVRFLDNPNHLPMAKSEMMTWLKLHVQKNDKLKTMVLSDKSYQRSCFHLMDYVLYRYTNLETLQLGIPDTKSHLDEAFNAIKHIPHVQINETTVKVPQNSWMFGHELKCTSKMLYSC